MTTLTCPKCRRGLPDDALDDGLCPLCGFPLDGPVVLSSGARGGGTRLLLAVGMVLLLAAAGAGYAIFDRLGTSNAQQPPVEVAVQPAEQPAVEVRPIAPFPHEPKRQGTNVTNTQNPPDPPGVGDKGQPPEPVAIVNPPKKDGPRPVAVGISVDPKIAPVRHLDQPDDIAKVPDLNTGDRVVLTGRVRRLELGQVLGKGVLDASGLVAEEVEIKGDLSSEARVQIHAPNGTVTVKGYVNGAAKLTVSAPGGELVVAESGRMSGTALITATAKRLEVKCPMSGNARVEVTLTAGGALKLGLMEDGATVTYKRSAAADPPLVIEKGVMRGAAKVIAGN